MARNLSVCFVCDSFSINRTRGKRSFPSPSLKRVSPSPTPPGPVKMVIVGIWPHDTLPSPQVRGFCFFSTHSCCIYWFRGPRSTHRRLSVQLSIMTVHTDAPSCPPRWPSLALAEPKNPTFNIDQGLENPPASASIEALRATGDDVSTAIVHSLGQPRANADAESQSSVTANSTRDRTLHTHSSPFGDAMTRSSGRSIWST